MSQHDMTIDDSNGAAVLADISAALQALASSNSGSGTPTVTFPFQVWADSDDLLWYQRDSGDSFDIAMGPAHHTSVGSATSGPVTLTVGDWGKIYRIVPSTVDITVNLPLSTGLPIGRRWWAVVYNDGSLTTGKNVVLDGQGSDTVNGATTALLSPGEACLIRNDGGVGWRAFFLLGKEISGSTSDRFLLGRGVRIRNITAGVRWGVHVDGTGALVMSDDTNTKTPVVLEPNALATLRMTSARADISSAPATAGTPVLGVDRTNNDGDLVHFLRNGVSKGVITVAGEAVSYGNFLAHHPSQWAAGEAPESEPPGGTLVETVDEPCQYREIWRQQWVEDERGRHRAGDQWRPEPYAGTERDGTLGTEPHNYVDPVTGQHASIPLGWRVTHRVEPRLARVRVCREPLSRRVYGVLAGRQGDGDLIIHALGAGQALVTGPAAGGDLLVAAGDGTVRALQEGEELPSGRLAACIVGRVTIGDNATAPRLVSCVLSCG